MYLYPYDCGNFNYAPEQQPRHFPLSTEAQLEQSWGYDGPLGGPSGSGYLPSPPNVAPLRALWYLSDGIWGLLKASWRMLIRAFLWAPVGFWWGLFYDTLY